MNGLLQFLQDTYWPQRSYDQEYYAQKEAAQGILGPQIVEPDGPGLPGDGPAGLLVPDRTTPAYQVNTGAALAGLPMYKTQGTTMMNQGVNNAVWQQQQAEMNQRARMQQQMEMSRRMGPYQDMSQYQSNIQPILDDARTDLAPMENAARYYSGVQQILTDKKGVENMDGADQLAVLTAFFKMRNPGEAMNVRDEEAAREAAGVWGISENLLASMFQGKPMDPKNIIPILNTMKSLATDLEKEHAEKYKYYQGRLQRGGFDPREMRPAAQFESYEPGPSTIPADAVPVDSQRIPLQGYGGKFGG